MGAVHLNLIGDFRHQTFIPTLSVILKMTDVLILTEDPKTALEALCHFSLVEHDRAPIPQVLCISDNLATFASIRKWFKRLEIIIHPDRCSKIVPRCLT